MKTEPKSIPPTPGEPVVEFVRLLARYAAEERRRQRSRKIGEPSECVAFGRATAFALSARFAWIAFGKGGAR